VSTLNTQLVGHYAAIIAENYPATQGSDCPNKTHQTNAIIYRDGRLSLSTATTYQAVHFANGACVANGQPRTRAVMARFYDAQAAQYISVASVHWPTTDQGGGTACAFANQARVRDQLNSGLFDTSALKIWGGDTNTSEFITSAPTSGYEPWYSAANGDLSGNNFRDVIFDDCAETNPNYSSSGMKACLRGNATVGSSRYDYLMASRKSANRPFIGAEATVTASAADSAHHAADAGEDTAQSYSDHLAIIGRVHYAATG
jgi:hypothetical protein